MQILSVGEVGKSTTVDEVRLEMLVSEIELQDVVSVMADVHPYEQPAFDVIEVQGEIEDEYDASGAGRILELDRLQTPQELAERLRGALGVNIRLAHGDCDAIRTVAVCPGSGGGLFAQLNERVDAYVTGEMQHHDVLEICQRRGRCVMLAGHTHTERPLLPRYQDVLQQAIPQIEWLVSEKRCIPLG